MSQDKDIFAKAARLEAENKRLQEENARLNNTLDASIENTERSIRQTDEAMRRWLEACAELEPLRKVANAAVAVYKTITPAMSAGLNAGQSAAREVLFETLKSFEAVVGEYIKQMENKTNV